ncbi:MAG TPA: hypothetical protein VMR62_23875 [Bryobacteraceae bacterium]|jgi:hypothetical protein|nr:hypothetical protein [Bryobacteraceae bacterium]
MLRVIILTLVTVVLFGQGPQAVPVKAPQPDPQRPPIEVDAALRARVSQFYQYEIDRKFYRALQLVAEDTRDYFVESSKAPYLGFQIDTISYSDGFTKAAVVALVSRLVPVEGFMGHPLPTKMTTRWKLENGQWCYYVDPRDLRVTPFGPAPPNMFSTARGAPAAPHPNPAAPLTPAKPAAGTPGLPSAPGVPVAPVPRVAGTPGLGVPPSNIPRMLFADQDSIQLKSAGASSGQVTISNPTPFPATVTVAYPTEKGLTVKLDPPTIYPNQKAVLSVQSSGGGKTAKAPVTISLKVQQTNQVIPISISFAN